MDIKEILRGNKDFYETCNSSLIESYYISIARKPEYDNAFAKNLPLVYRNSIRAKSIVSNYQTFSEYFSVYYPLLVDETTASLIASIHKTEYKNMFKQKIFAIDRGATTNTVFFSTKNPKNPNIEEEEKSAMVGDFVIIMSSSEHKCMEYHFCGIISNKRGTEYEMIVHKKVVLKMNDFKIPKYKNVFLVVTSNLVANKREYLALVRTMKTEWKDLIINPLEEKKIHLKSNKWSNIIPEYTDEHFNQLNNSQKTAVSLALKRKLTLIQGPPGTGKTRTISCLISQCIKRGLKVLVTAPSNIAVDALVQTRDSWSHLFKKEKWVHLSRIKKDLNNKSPNNQLKAIKTTQINQKDTLKSKYKDSEDLEEEYKDSKSLKEEYNNSKNLEEGLLRIIVGNDKNISTFYIDTRKKKEKEDPNHLLVLKEANLVFSTLSMSESSALSNMDFDFVIVDEACQALEYSTLMSIYKSKDKVLLVGDPMQLPPTVISNADCLKVSLFERISKMVPPILLNVQYRMHSAIANFPNNSFYNGCIRNGVQRDSPVPVVFLSINSREEKHNTSYYNEEEINTIENIIVDLDDMYDSIGVLTPYSEQALRLKKSLTVKATNACISTIDGFQGQESDCIIISTVRTSAIGFLNDFRRTNVALTRAKYTVVVLGKRELLVKDPIWRAFINYADKNKYSYNMSQIKDLKNLFKAHKKASTLRV